MERFAPDPTFDERAMATGLLEREGSEHPGLTDSAAAERVLGRLHERCSAWFGRDVSDSVLACALHRARSTHPALADVHLDANTGTTGERRLPGLTEPLEHCNADDATEAVVTLLSAVLALLSRLIGAGLVGRLVEQAGPAGEMARRTGSVPRPP